MAIFSYIALVLCVHCYFVHILALAKAFTGRIDRSGSARFYQGHFFLATCVYFASNFGWTF